jgi:hypothetical protein
MTPRRLLLLAVALAVAAAVWRAGSLPGTTSIGAGPVASSPTGGAVPAPRVESGHPEIGFLDRSHLEAHYRKHGAELGRFLKPSTSVGPRRSGIDRWVARSSKESGGMEW